MSRIMTIYRPVKADSPIGAASCGCCRIVKKTRIPTAVNRIDLILRRDAEFGLTWISRSKDQR